MGHAALATEQAAQPQEPVAAALKLHEADFTYRSSRNFFSCDELRNAVAVILRALGARDDVQVRALDCMGVMIPDATISDGSTTWNNNWDRSTRQQSPMERMRSSSSAARQSTPVHIQAMLPVVANDKVLKEMEQDKSRRELISRVTGNMAAALNDPILFAATRQQVTLSHETIKLEPEHCELLDQMISSVFRRFDMRVVRKSLACDPHQRSNFPPQVTVEALLPVGYVLPGAEKQKEREKKKEQEQAEQEQEQEQSGAAAEPQAQEPPSQ